ncbi:hypothetical protein [Mobiluncus curtisii]|uniref:hypothetical protein n=1 Tax=Mobiluncus curtisii TaxID=2051 RepID=UPI00242DBE1E|nr:hypothetical protein [Mobiluncus curtisii]
MNPPTLNIKAAKECLNILTRTKPHLYENPRELLPIWAEALDPDLPTGTAHKLTVDAYGEGVEFISPADINHRWRALKKQRLERNMEPPDPPYEIATNPNAYHEYLCTWRHLIATGIHPRDATPAALSNAKQQALLNANQKLQIGTKK